MEIANSILNNGGGSAWMTSLPIQLALTGLLCSAVQHVRDGVDEPAKRVAALLGAPSDQRRSKFAQQIVNFVFHIFSTVTLGYIIFQGGWLESPQELFEMPR